MAAALAALLSLIAFLPGPALRPCARTVPQLPALRAVATDDAASRGWAQRLRSASAAAAAALVLAVPRGPARAAQESLAAPVPTPVSAPLDVTRDGASEPEAAFLGIQRRKKLTPPYLKTNPPRPDELDMDAIAPKKLARRFTERDFIFSDGLTAKSELEEELEELEVFKESSKGSRALQTVATTGGAVALVYLSVQGLGNVERWLKKQELADMEEERELTGTYISVDASDVDSAIDPTTGKNLTISRAKSTSNATAADDGEAAAAKQAPWILRVLGLEGAADDDDFWEPPEPSMPKGDGGGGGGGGGSTDEGGDGGVDEEEDDDDTTGIDALDDLM